MPPTVTRRCVIVIIVTLVIYLLWYIAAMATTCSHGDDKGMYTHSKRQEICDIFCRTRYKLQFWIYSHMIL